MQLDYVDEYQCIFNISVEFGCLCNELVFDKWQLLEFLFMFYFEYYFGVRVCVKDKLKFIESWEILVVKVVYFILCNLGVVVIQLEDVVVNFNMIFCILQ